MESIISAIGARYRRRGALAGAVVVLVLLALAAPAGAAAPAPAWQLSVVHGPTNVPIQAPVNQVETVTITGESGGAPNGGRFKLEFANPEEKEGHTKWLPYNATAAEVQAALEAVKAIGPGNVQVTGGPQLPGETSWTYTITFVGLLGGQELELLEEESEITAAEEKRIKKQGEVPEGAEAEVELVRNGSHDTVFYEIIPTNVGGAPTSGKITVTDTLPPGVTTRNAPFGQGWTCKPTKKGASQFTCTREAAVLPGAEVKPVHVEAYVDAESLEEGQQLVDKATIAGGGVAGGAQVSDVATVSNTPASFGIVQHSFHAASYGPGGEEFTQAGGHPTVAMTQFFFNTVNRFDTESESYELSVPGQLKDANVTVPAGFIGNPLATERCPQKEFTQGTKGGPVSGGHCRENSRVGTAWVYINGLEAEPERVALYNLEPPPTAPAELGFIYANVPVRIDGHVIREPNGEYRIGVFSADVNAAYNIMGVGVTLWGTPADHVHDAERTEANTETTVRPFVTAPTDCLASASEPPSTTITYDRWERPGPLDLEGLPVLGPDWFQETVAEPPVTGCDKLAFEPTVGFEPASKRAAAPTGYTFKLDVPNNEDPNGLAVPELKDTSVTLPPGVSLSPSAANGLAACTDEQINVASTQRGNCPDASQVGTVTITSQLLESPLNGRVYVGEPECSPCSPADAESGRIFRLFIEAEGSGVRVKLPGTASVNQSTGQISTTFANNPQTPFTHLELKLKGGERATLANPQTCGNFELAAAMTPWSVEGTTPEGEHIPGDPVSHISSAFAIDWDGEGGACPGSLPFSPSFQAGTENTQAGAYSPFDVVFKRGDDREQDLAGTTVTTPPGLLGKIAGIARCQEPAAAAGTCPAGSRIATATSVAGPGSQPFVVSGPVYLTDGYKGAPFGLSVAVPAKAGPFNLGTVVVRAAIRIDKSTSAITITSDPLPQSVDGVPFRLKQIDVRVDRPEFMFNATNCEQKAISTTLGGAPQQPGEAAGAVTRTAPYTASGCSSLGFSPTFTGKTNANVSRVNGTSFEVAVTAKPGQANIHQVELRLPKTLPSRLPTLHGACPDNVFNANPANCPSVATVGTATAVTPLLSKPLTGPAILVSHANLSFPDLVFLLQGEGVLVELVGHTDIKNGFTYSRFETVPDAPVSSFVTTFPAGPHSILSGFGNLCEEEQLAPTKIVGQNGATVSLNTKIAVAGCGKPSAAKIAISNMRLRGGSLLIGVKLSAAGTVKIKSSGLKTTTKSLSAGSHTVAVKLTKAGLAAHKAHHKIHLTVTLTSNGSSSTKAAGVKL